MTTAGFLDVCRFNPTAGGMTNWTVSTAVTGYQTPALGGAVNGTIYRYRAESSDLTQWEVGYGAYTVSGTVLARTTVLYNSSGTGTGAGQSGAGSLINFSAVPQVAIVGLAEDLISFALHTRTRTIYTSGSGTYTVPTGCTAINVRLVGGGGAGGGSGSSPTAGGAGASTTFNFFTLILTGSGGSGGCAANSTSTVTGGSATGGDINIQGGSGWSVIANTVWAGGSGAAGPFGGAGAGGNSTSTAGAAAAANSGAGGGGAGNTSLSATGGGGAAGGYVEKLISSPASTYTYAVGTGGTAGTGGGSGGSGGVGGSGVIIIDEFY